ncbi:uncharacterized protein LOC105298734 isoform X5 [Pteropus vampyrus]|uniref:Uncharacterized protein LOC105298734 isoform X5 n=1 Tax=Pteropus vampyrus TaxID=132908 RepID=A0A6P6CYK4_PTEVA|nr:uncharacterized protein LOC105298734 isoform X5 [Pteropus vampyrus]
MAQERRAKAARGPEAGEAWGRACTIDRRGTSAAPGRNSQWTMFRDSGDPPAFLPAHSHLEKNQVVQCSSRLNGFAFRREAVLEDRTNA